jgi:hypothetical protein
VGCLIEGSESAASITAIIGSWRISNLKNEIYATRRAAWLAKGQPLEHLFNVDITQERAKVQMIYTKKPPSTTTKRTFLDRFLHQKCKSFHKNTM